MDLHSFVEWAFFFCSRSVWYFLRNNNSQSTVNTLQHAAVFCSNFIFIRFHIQRTIWIITRVCVLTVFTLSLETTTTSRYVQFYENMQSWECAQTTHGSELVLRRTTLLTASLDVDVVKAGELIMAQLNRKLEFSWTEDKVQQPQKDGLHGFSPRSDQRKLLWLETPAILETSSACIIMLLFNPKVSCTGNLDMTPHSWSGCSLPTPHRVLNLCVMCYEIRLLLV